MQAQKAGTANVVHSGITGTTGKQADASQSGTEAGTAGMYDKSVRRASTASRYRQQAVQVVAASKHCMQAGVASSDRKQVLQLGTAGTANGYMYTKQAGAASKRATAESGTAGM